MQDEFPPPPMARDAEANADAGAPDLSATAADTRHAMPETGTMPAGERKSAQARGADQLPERFGRYAVIDALGRGAMGAVYLAHDSQLDRRVALKVPHSTILQNPQTAERFVREARAAAALDHPNICSVYDVGEIDGTNFIAMAYVEGQTLAALIKNNDEPLPQPGVADLIRKLALALAEAHTNGVVHRDLKPANIMINKRFEPVIMDFGLALLAGTGDSRLTADGAVMGTPAYMSPEQAAGDKQKIGPSSDVYALGVIMYEMLTGRLPFEGSVGEVLAKIASETPPTVSRVQPDVDPKLAAICSKAMNKKIEDRYATMEELAADLGAYLQTSSVAERTIAGGKLTDGESKAIEGGEKPSSLHLAAELLANLAARIESGQLSGVPADRDGPERRWPWWVWAASAVVLAGLIVLAILPFVGTKDVSESVAVRIDIDNFNQYVNAVFILDGEQVPREKLAGPLELGVGRHELIVRRDGEQLAQYAFEVKEDAEQPVFKPEPDPHVAGPVPGGPKPIVPPARPERPDLPTYLKTIKVEPTLALWCAPRYSAADSPFHTAVTINKTAVGTFHTAATMSIAANVRPGWNTIVLNTAPQAPAKNREWMWFSIGTAVPKSGGRYETRPLMSFANGEHWTLKDGRYVHQLDPKAKQMPLTFRFFYAGLKYERRKPREGDFVLTGGPHYSGSNPSLTATVFVNGIPLTSFGQGSRSAVVTDLLHAGGNEIKLVTSPVENCLSDNDVRITLAGPATYDAGSGKLTYRPILWLSAATGWTRNKTTQRLDSALGPPSKQIERTVSFYLPDPIENAGRFPKKSHKLFVFASRHYTGDENSLHSNLTINGRRVGRFTSDTRELAEGPLKRGDWNTVELETESMHPGITDNDLRFAVRPVGPNAQGEIRQGPVLWWFKNGQGWRARDGRLYHRSGNKATRVKLAFHLFLGDMRHENQKLAEGDYLLAGGPHYSSDLPSVTSTVSVNGTRLTTFAGIKRAIVLKPPLIKKGVNEIRLETKPVENCFADNDCSFSISGPAKYSVAAAKVVPGKVVARFSSLTGWTRNKDDLKLVNSRDPDANTLTRTIRFEVK